MKTAISIPNDVFADAEKLTRALKKSRSRLYSHALKEYVARHAADQVTEALDRVCGDGHWRITTSRKQQRGERFGARNSDLTGRGLVG